MRKTRRAEVEFAVEGLAKLCRFLRAKGVDVLEERRGDRRVLWLLDPADNPITVYEVPSCPAR